MSRSEIILQGGGDHARVVLDCLLEQGERIQGIFDPKYEGNLFGVPHFGAYQPELFPDAKAIIAIGDNAVRKRVALMTKHSFTHAIHSSAIISKRSVIGLGSMILHRSVVQANTKIGDHVIVNTGSQVDHDCIIEDFVHLGPGTVLCGTITVGEGTFVGAGTTIIPGIKIGKWSVIGAGSVVVRDIPDGVVAFGNPATVIKKRSV